MAFTYIANKLKTKKIPDGSTIETYQVYKSNKRFITFAELKTIVERMAGRRNFEFNIRGHADRIRNVEAIQLRALRPDRWSTLKNFEGDLSYQDEEDYLDGRVPDTTKFAKYYQLELTVIKKPPR